MSSTSVLNVLYTAFYSTVTLSSDPWTQMWNIHSPICWLIAPQIWLQSSTAQYTFLLCCITLYCVVTMH